MTIITHPKKQSYFDNGTQDHFSRVVAGFDHLGIPRVIDPYKFTTLDVAVGLFDVSSGFCPLCPKLRFGLVVWDLGGFTIVTILLTSFDWIYRPLPQTTYQPLVCVLLWIDW